RQSVTSPSGAVLLLVTDNFLKSEQCMYGALEALQHWADNGQLVPIVAEGRYPSPDGATWESVPTSFERVSNIINYMNFWQDNYLVLRKAQRSNDEDEKLEAQIEVTKQVSSEVGEFLRYLRNLRWLQLGDFKAGNYAAFRQFTDENPEAVAPAGTGEQAPVLPQNNTEAQLSREKTLAEIIEDSGEELMAENTDIGKPKTPVVEDEQPPVDLNDIPGLDQLKQLDERAHVKIASPKKEDEEEGVELSAILNEVLGEDEEAEDFKFLGEDPDRPEDFDLESLFDEEEDAPAANPEPELDEIDDEVSLELISDEDEGLVLRADGQGHATPEEVLEHAVLLFDDGQQQEGLNFLRQTVQLNASDNTMRYYYAYALARYGGDFSNAKSQLEVILANDMEHTDALFLLGELSESQGDFEDAKHNFETVAALQPDFPEVYYRLGVLTLQHFEGQENLAMEFFKKSVEFNQRNADAQYILATLYNEHVGDVPNAIKHFNLALRFNPKHAYANYDLALLHHQNGDNKAASEHYQRAVALNPELVSPENDAAFLASQNEVKTATTTTELVENEQGPSIEAAPAEQLDAVGETMELVETEAPVPGIEEAVDNFAALDEVAEELDGPATDIEAAVDNFVALEEAAEELDAPTELEELELAVQDEIEAMPAEQPLTVEPTLEDLLEGGFEEAEESVAPIADAKMIADPSNKNFTATLEEILDQEDEMVGDDFVLPLSNDKSTVEVKTVLITGATSGIGRATAEIFARNGSKVIATGRRSDRLEQLSAYFKEKYNAALLTLPFDVRNLEAVEAAIELLPEAWRDVDILINNAGLSRGLSPIHEGDIEHWETMIDTNIKGLLYLTRAVAPLMVKRRSGHIINVASSAGKEVYPGGNVYCATKFAVDALTKSMRLDLYAHNIRVSQVAPGHVEETEFASVRFDGDTERAAKVYENFQPLRASDVAEVIYFMATRPPHVNVQDVLLFSTQQAGSNFIDRSGRGDKP
ncbi:MAG: SDR family NAD(P)-dependent oxidoreductase, partial [Saprospiraceae bacterium]|nr:SDR family NAD(P)-dependent oxidoreductase [Saprospiraceae bacterium]